MSEELLKSENSMAEVQAEVSFLLPSVLTIETVEATGLELKLKAFAFAGRISLDASQLESLTTPGLQLIVSLAKTVGANGGSLRITGLSEPVVHAFMDTGLKLLLDTVSKDGES